MKINLSIFLAATLSAMLLASCAKTKIPGNRQDGFLNDNETAVIDNKADNLKNGYVSFASMDYYGPAELLHSDEDIKVYHVDPADPVKYAEFSIAYTDDELIFTDNDMAVIGFVSNVRDIFVEIKGISGSPMM
ncbi:MAG: hypothetical protein FWE82_04805 [Defluviitaleaceae bacterium]|nr:hypothetical protein [Defluviitaleaceae bacterium]